MNGEPFMTARVSVRRDGSVRTEVGDDVVVIVSTEEKQVLTLLKSAHLAIVSPIDEAPTKEDDLAWLDEIREFQGAAKALRETRVIDGQRAHGWELPIEGGTIELWANDEGLPLRMSLNQGVAIEMSFRFEFEPKLAADEFSTRVPDGYSRGESED